MADGTPRPRSALLARAAQAVRAHAEPVTMGRVARVTGLLVEAHVPDCRIGDVVEIERDGGRVAAEVVGLRDSVALLIALGEVRGISAGARVHATGQHAEIPASEELWGRVVDAFGRPIDGGAPFSA